MDKAFYSFHFDNDVFRAALVRNMGVVSGDAPISDHSWESIKRSGEQAIKKWISDQMRSCKVVIVLVGKETASRPWVNHEICYAWDNYFPIFGIRIHGLNSMNEPPTTQGANPFQNVVLQNGQKLSDIVPLHMPAGSSSKEVYASISANLSAWIRNAPQRNKS